MNTLQSFIIKLYSNNDKTLVDMLIETHSVLQRIVVKFEQNRGGEHEPKLEEQQLQVLTYVFSFPFRTLKISMNNIQENSV